MGVGTPSSTVPAHARAFGKYTLLAKLATGGMAEIFLARMKGVAGFEKQVVIKRILPQYADDEQFVAMFLDEARIAARINHPNVCQVYELGEVDGQYYLSMEYLEGVPLTTVLRKITKDGRQSDLRLVTALVVQACEGLHNAHELKDPGGQPVGVVHRDVSPQNLFVTVDGTVKVLDFGIAKAQGAAAKTRTGTVKGKYAYMSPEQLRGEALDRRSDVFALGVVLFESVTGRRLFHRETDYLIFKAITDEPIPSVRELRQDLPPALAMTIHKALSRNRDERTPTARALGQGVAKAMDPYGGLMSQLAVAEVIEATFAEEIAKVREKIAAALAESNRLDAEVPRVDLGTDSNASGQARRLPSRSPEMPPEPPMQMDAPEQLSDRAIDPAHFVAAPPEEPDESATDVWDGSMRPPWEVARSNEEDQATAAAPAELMEPLVSSMAPLESIMGQAIESQIEPAVTPPPVMIPAMGPPTPPSVPPPMHTPHDAMTPSQPMGRIATGVSPVIVGPPTGGGTSFAMEELRPKRRVGLWLAGVVVGLLGAAAYVLVTSGAEDAGGIQSTEARTETTVVVPGPIRPSVDPPAGESEKGDVKPPVRPENAPEPTPEAKAEAKPPEPTRPEGKAPEGKAPEGKAPEAKPAAPARVEPPRAEVKRPAPPVVTPVRKPREARDSRDDDDREPPRKTEEKAVPAGPPGFFTVDAQPYAIIYIDGKNVGPTPVIKYSLPPGRHTVKAVPQSGGARPKTISVTITSGELSTHKFSW